MRYFNSSKVQLELLMHKNTVNVRSYFNSSKVQLELLTARGFPHASLRFQFQ